uniref:Uncharacterized protein n=1 Tax=Oryza sativa subsp. japonica TaxID=39947 RepID=Q2QSM7_ORYSJ|nr:hypothetical protein LOC_Os12g23570 [Oryza sativa Japonica Group]
MATIFCLFSFSSLSSPLAQGETASLSFGSLGRNRRYFSRWVYPDIDVDLSIPNPHLCNSCTYLMKDKERDQAVGQMMLVLPAFIGSEVWPGEQSAERFTAWPPGFLRGQGESEQDRIRASQANPSQGLCGTSGTQKSWVIIGPMLRAKPIPTV